MPVIDFESFNKMNYATEPKQKDTRRKENKSVLPDTKPKSDYEQTLKSIIVTYKKEKDMEVNKKKEILIMSLKDYANKYQPYKDIIDD